MGQLTREEIEKAQGDPNHRLRLAESRVKLPEQKRVKKGPRYTPVSRRHDRPNAILWLVRNHPELKDAQIMRLVGTTKTTIQQVRERTHWNSASLSPMDPVTLGLCSQIDLDFEVQRAAKDRPHVEVQEHGGTLMPAEVSTAPERRRPLRRHEPPEAGPGREDRRQLRLRQAQAAQALRRGRRVRFTQKGPDRSGPFRLRGRLAQRAENRINAEARCANAQPWRLGRRLRGFAGLSRLRSKLAFAATACLRADPRAFFKASCSCAFSSVVSTCARSTSKLA